MLHTVRETQPDIDEPIGPLIGELDPELLDQTSAVGRCDLGSGTLKIPSDAFMPPDCTNRFTLGEGSCAIYIMKMGVNNRYYRLSRE